MWKKGKPEEKNGEEDILKEVMTSTMFFNSFVHGKFYMFTLMFSFTN